MTMQTPPVQQPPSAVTQPTPTATPPVLPSASRAPSGGPAARETEEITMASPSREDQLGNTHDTPLKSHHDELPDAGTAESMAEPSGAQNGKADGLATDDKGTEEHKRREGEKKERERKNTAKKPREQYSCVECFR